MKTSFAAACLLGFAAASPPDKLVNSRTFANYMSAQNKSYETSAEMGMRASLFAANENEVRSLNARSAASGKSNAAIFEVNFTSDMRADEKSALLSLVEKDRRERKSFKKSKKNKNKKNKNRVGVDDARTVDLVKDGFMHPVKDQGMCGSCYSFASNTALEGAIAIKNKAAPVHISEQHMVDCTREGQGYTLPSSWYNYSCNGGWMDVCWNFQKKYGIMLEKDYAYTGKHQQRCKHDEDKVVGKVTKMGNVGSVDAAKAKLVTHPLTIAIDAGKAVFQNYKSGVIGKDQNCGTSINHAVVIVGYTEEGGDESEETEPESESESEGEDPVGCNVQKWWHSCGDNNRRQLQSSKFDNYWKIQNSWGTWWGDEGFVLFEITDGKGVCGMNQYIDWAEADNM